ncbi:MAG: Coenzyme F420 hydrogenase/dehydrogenase, beta subunit C-terminal domain [Bacteroidota bacterium]
MSNKSESRELLDKVISQDYCIGCGACAAVKDSPFRIKMNEYGNIVAYAAGDVDSSPAKVLSVCPFSGVSMNEDEIGDLIFADVQEKSSKIGRYLDNYAGHVNDDAFRSRGSSGGVGKWLGYTLLKEKMVDYFIQVVPNSSKDPSKPLFDYAVISDVNEVLKGSKSSYYPVSLVNMIEVIRKQEGRYAITGVPCFIKTLRLLASEDEVFRSRVKYTIGIVCGGMKSANHAKMVGWQMKVNPRNLVAIDFRRKYPDKPAKYKIYQVWSDQDDRERYLDSYDIYGTDFGAGYFKPNACDYCDDVVNETADISIGDAWLPSFEADPKGTTILTVRNREIGELIARKISEGELTLEVLSADDVARSQAGGFRHRRDALSYRIAKKDARKEWYPVKRVKANEIPIDRKRKRIYNLREKIARQSHISFYHALQKDDLEVFFREMKPLFKSYVSANYGVLPVRVFNKLKKKVLNKIKGR